MPRSRRLTAVLLALSESMLFRDDEDADVPTGGAGGDPILGLVDGDGDTGDPLEA